MGGVLVNYERREVRDVVGKKYILLPLSGS